MRTKPFARRAPKDLSLKQLAQDVIDSARKIVSASGIRIQGFDDVIEQVIDQAMPKLSANLYKDLRDGAPGFADGARQFNQGFRQRNLERWKPAFDLLDAKWAVAHEANAEFFRDERSG